MYSVRLAVGVLVVLVALGGANAAAAARYTFLEETAADAYDLSAEVRLAGGGDARLCFDYRAEDNHHYLRVARGKVALVRVRDGKTQTLPVPLDTGATARESVSLLVKRRPEKISLLVNGRLALVVGDLSAGEGKVGYATTGEAQVTEPRLQPVEPPAFADDFMRAAGEPGPWETASGRWTQTTVGDVTKSANGFFYRGEGAPALAVTGFPFWDDYIFQASVKCTQPEGTFGLCFYYQDPANYLGLLWGSNEGLRLVRVVNGVTRVLAENKRVAWVPDQWYRLAVQVVDSDLTALVDGGICLEARDPSFGRGAAALYASGKEVYFDDVAIKPALYFREEQPAARPERWAATRGAHIIGSTAWQDYTYRARLRPSGTEGVRLVFGWRAPDDYHVLRWGADKGRGPGAGRLQILHWNGKERLLAEAPGGYVAQRNYDVEITFRPGYAAVSIDGKRRLEAAGASLQDGAIGAAPLSALRAVAVRQYEEPPPPEEEITSEFTNSAAHPDMAEWADPSRAWVPRPSPLGATFWRKGEHFGDTWVHLSVPPMADTASVAVSLAADGEDPQTGYTFTLQRAAQQVVIQLHRQGNAVEKATLEAPADQAVPVTLTRQGTFLTAAVAEQPLLAYQDPKPLTGSRVALRTTPGVPLDLKGVNVRSRHTYDYTFHDAPVDWQPQSGVWEITSRWSCQPGWSWFGGWSEQVAAIWSKRRFSGDLVLEYYAAPKMDAVPEAYELRFRDLNATICGDGKRLNSGYSFIIGGWGNTKTAILRGDRVVAETAAYRLPPQGTGHRLWFYVRIEKRGNRLSLSVDNAPVLTYEDPNPLRGDRVALWTQNNGIMLARVAVSYQQEQERVLVARAPGEPHVAAIPAVPGDAAGPQVATAPAPAAPAPPPQQAVAQEPPPPPPAPEQITVIRRKARNVLTERFANGESRAAWVGAVGDWAVTAAGHFAPKAKPEFAYALTGDPEWQDYEIEAELIGGQDAGLLLRARDWDNCVLLVIRPAQNDLWWIIRRDGAWASPMLGRVAPDFRAGKPLKVRATVVGDTYTCFLDGKPVSQIQDGSFASGRVGLYVKPLAEEQAWDNVRVGLYAEPQTPPVQVAAVEPAVPAPPRALLTETFDGRGKRVRWEAAEGDWSVTPDGHFAPTEKREYAYAFTGDPEWTDYELRADLINGHDAGLFVRAQDWDNCVFLVIRPAHRDLWWFVRRDGEWGAVLAPVTLEFGPKPVLPVTVTVVGDTYTCFIEDRPVSQIKDGTFPKGRIGVYIKPDWAGQAWDNLEVRQPGITGAAVVSKRPANEKNR
jgi:hypothetical protein